MIVSVMTILVNFVPISQIISTWLTSSVLNSCTHTKTKFHWRHNRNCICFGSDNFRHFWA